MLAAGMLEATLPLSRRRAEANPTGMAISESKKNSLTMSEMLYLAASFSQLWLLQDHACTPVGTCPSADTSIASAANDFVSEPHNTTSTLSATKLH